ncbi:MAG: hypothetical protein FWG71_01075 [Synergistaceae bacterium]|nr:hypothetical protein [Synergistaceae bacterium]
MKKHILRSLLFFALFSLVIPRGAPVFAATANSPALSILTLSFVDNVTGLSQYTPKQGARFAIGDTCMIYLETTGFTLHPVRPDSEDEFDLDLAVDIEIKMPQRRRVIVSENNFHTLKTTMRSKLPIAFLAFGFPFDEDWTPGDYLIELTLRDNFSEQSVTESMIYQLERPTDADLARQGEESGTP